MKITIQSTLLPRADPPFVGTQIRVRVPHEPGGSLEYGLFAVKRPEPGFIDWGDGSRQEFTTLSYAVHTYPSPGTYLIRIDAGLSDFVPVTLNPKYEYPTKYAPCVLGVVSNDESLPYIGANGFNGCLNMTQLDFRSAGIDRLVKANFKGCAALTGEVYFPLVASVQGTAGDMPFEGCTGITAIHFAKQHEAAITGGAAYQADPTLGTGVPDVCVFDP